MASVLNTCNIFLHLLILSVIHESLAREIPKGAEQNIETAYVSQEKFDENHLILNHVNNNDESHFHMHKSSPHLDHIDPTWQILFHYEDLKLGKNIPLYFTTTTQSSHLIPKEEADTIPFSSAQFSNILEFFTFSRDSPQGEAMAETLNHCELPPMRGETKFCATSLESMLNELSLQFGEGSNFRVLTTPQVKNWTPHLQNYTILEEPKELYGDKMFSCHPMPYPYVVYYCHGQKSENRFFELSLEGEDGLKLEALAICHMDTSDWDPDHISFRVLGFERGTPVCHMFAQDNLVWVSSPSSGN